MLAAKIKHVSMEHHSGTNVLQAADCHLVCLHWQCQKSRKIVGFWAVFSWQQDFRGHTTRHHSLALRWSRPGRQARARSVLASPSSQRQSILFGLVSFSLPSHWVFLLPILTISYSNWHHHQLL